MSEYNDAIPLEWVIAKDLTNLRDVLLPANFIWCPYIAPRGAATIVSSSTNGAAAGKNVSSAIQQGLFEIIERDAFWFAGRTNGPTYRIPEEDIPTDILTYVQENDWALFTFTILPTPFRNVFVSQVVLETDRPNVAKTARGTGATMSYSGSIRRAFNECLQMYHSLTSTLGEPETILDMRSLWSTGRSRHELSNFFTPIDYNFNRDELDPDTDTLKHLIQQSKEQGLNVYNYILMETNTFAVCKPVITNLAVTDPSKFNNNNRFKQISEICYLPYGPITYQSSMFM